MSNRLVGTGVRRKEDARFVTGTGRYVDDIALPGTVCGVVLRADRPHAEILAIDTGVAAAMPGVLGIWTAEDLDALGIGGLPCGWVVPLGPGKSMAMPTHPVLARGRVRHVGDPVAFVVALTRGQALDAMEAIRVTYRDLPFATDMRAATAAGATAIWAEAPGNLCYDWHVGDGAATDAAFASAEHVVTLDLVNNRVNAHPMETRGVIGEHDRSTDRYTLYTSNQNPHIIRVLLAAATLKVGEEKIRVVSPDVGGGFGMKIYHYAEEVLALVAARAVGRPVKWIADRTEAHLSDTDARDHLTRVEGAFDAEGRMTGLRVDTLANMGAYLSTFAPAIPSFFYAYPMPGPYATRAVSIRVRAVFTNTTPVDAYRGAGRPEATYVLERLMDAAAAQIGLDRIELRRRNLIPPEAFPYKTPLLWTYDTGDLPALLDRTVDLVDHAGFPERRARSEAHGKRRGIGIAYYMESCGMGPSKLLAKEGCGAGQFEVGQVRVHPTGTVTVLTGSHTHGQGHETVYSQIVADALGVDYGAIDIVHGDTDRVAYGIGTYGSRSIAVGGSALHLSLNKVIEKGRKIASYLLEADVGDVEFADGRFRVKGSDLSVSFQAMAAAAYNPVAYPPDEIEPGLEMTTYFDPPDFTFPYGCHVAEVEVDPETGAVEVVALTAVDDFGNQMNPMIVAGQIHGGLAQGVGQALFEESAYDHTTGQRIAGSLMDYALPRASDLPSMTTASLTTACRNNPLGVKGCGEAGAIAGPAAVSLAVLDALRPLGVTHLDMPMTSERVWRAIRASRAASPA